MFNVACDTGGSDGPVEQAQDINQEREQVEDKDSKALTEAASTSMLSMELSRMAEERAVTPEVKEFASELSKEHSEVKQELEGVAQRKQIALPQDVSDDHRDKIENVSEKTGLDFDKEYIDEMISAHKDKIDDFENLSRESEDPEIREFAINTLPKLRMQLENAERVESQLQERDDSRADDGLFEGEGDVFGRENQEERGGMEDRKRGEDI